MNDLNILRENLEALNKELFETMRRRKEVTHTIQSKKGKLGQVVYSPQREILLFSKIKQDLQKLSIRELLAFSLIIEEDAYSFNKTYPLWSKKVHLALSTGLLEELINPILLKIYDFNLYNNLNLSQDFDFINKL